MPDAARYRSLDDVVYQFDPTKGDWTKRDDLRTMQGGVYQKAKTDWIKIGAVEATPVATSVQPPTTFHKGFFEALGTSMVEAVPQLRANIGGTVEAIGKTVGSPSITEFGAKTIGSQAPEPTVSADLQKAWAGEQPVGEYLGSVIGGNLPAMALTIGAGGLGLAVRGAKLATSLAGATSYLMNAGELYNNMRTQGVDAPEAALAAGIPMTALDVIEPLRIAGKLEKDAIKVTMKGVAKAFGVEGATEMGTETLQEGIGVATERYKGINSEVPWRLLNAAAGGLLVGGLAGAATHGVGRKPATTSEEPPPNPAETLPRNTPPPPPAEPTQAQLAQPRPEEVIVNAVQGQEGQGEQWQVGEQLTVPMDNPLTFPGSEIPVNPQGQMEGGDISILPSTGDAPADMAPPSVETTPTYASPLEEVVATKLPRRGNGMQILSTILNQGQQMGVTKEELDDIGLTDWLSQQQGPIERDTVLAMVRDKTPKLQEKLLTTSASNAEDTPVYGAYQIRAGSPNYGELLITLPDTELDEKLEEARKEYDKATREARIASMLEIPEAELNAALAREATATAAYRSLKAQKDRQFRTTHFSGEPNLLLHTRFNDQTTTDGETTLHIEELQSDWHKEGRKKGYGEAVPNAPMKKSWHEYGFLRMLRMAAERGISRVTWTTGETQSDRWDASRVVNTIEYNPDTHVLVVEGQGRTETRISLPQRLYEFIGEELAARLLIAPRRRQTLGFLPYDQEPDQVHFLTGLDLKLGGKGFKDLYDQQLGQYARKLVRKYGGQVEDVEVGPELEIVQGQNLLWFLRKRGEPIVADPGTGYGPFVSEEQAKKALEARKTTVHSILMSPTMRASLLASTHPYGLPRMVRSEEVLATRVEAMVQNVMETRTATPIEPEPVTAPPDVMGPTPPTEPPANGPELPVVPPAGPPEPPTPPPPPDPGSGDSVNPSYVARAIRHFGRVSRKMLTLRQVGYKFPTFRPLQSLIAAVDRMNSIANHIKSEGDRILEDWRLLGRARAMQLSEFALEVTLRSDSHNRRYTDEQLAAMAHERGLDDDTFSVYLRIQGFNDKQMLTLQEVAEEDLRARVTNTQALESGIDILRAEFAEMRNRNYFPLSRFGKFTAVVRASEDSLIGGRRYDKGETVEFQTFETEQEAAHARDELLKGDYAGMPVTIGLDVLTESEREFLTFPPSALRAMQDRLGLTEQQMARLDDLIKSTAPTRSFLKHMRKRRGVKGFSHDGQRAFAGYVQSVANHIAKVSEKRHMESAVADAGREANAIRRAGQESAVANRQMQEWMNETVHHVLNPNSRFTALTGGLFAWHFVGVPKQVMINLTQIPIFTYAHLAANFGDVQATTAIVKAIKAVGHRYTKRLYKEGQWQSGLSQDLEEAMENAVAEGVLDQSFSSELAAAVNGMPLAQLLPKLTGGRFTGVSEDMAHFVRGLITRGLQPFKASEEINRRITFIAAYNLAKATGKVDPAKFAADAVHKTQGAYESSNRMPVARGDLKPLFIFKTYTQNALFFYKNDPGGLRALMMLMAMGGLLGFPFTEDLLDVLDLGGTWMKQSFGMKNPRVDLRLAMREYIKAVVGNADPVMHGLSRLPQSLFDISGSMSMGRLVPGTEPLTSALRGEVEGKQAILRAIEEFSGVAGAQGMNFTKALVEHSPDATAWRRLLMPAIARNIDQARKALTEGKLTAPNGDRLIDVDPFNPRDAAEVMGILMGFTPRRLAIAREEKYAPREMIMYYETRQRLVVEGLQRAILSKDKATIDKAKATLKSHNETVPHQFRLNPSDINRRLHQRIKGQRIREAGLPQQREYLDIYRRYQAALQ